MIRLLTAAFGELYRVAARGLARSHAAHSSGPPLTVWTDLDEDFSGAVVHRSSPDELLAELPPLYRFGPGQISNVFRFELLRRMQTLHPDDDLCWIDADMLVLSDPVRYLREGSINVMAHGRRDGQAVSCSNGLIVPGERYAIGGMWSIPPGPALNFLFDRLGEFPTWQDQGGPNRQMPDQLLLNHLVRRSGLPVHWISDDRSRIFNLEIGTSLHPVVGDPGLAALRIDGGRCMRDDREVAVFCWIKNKFDAHCGEDFSTFDPSVRAMLRAYYA